MHIKEFFKNDRFAANAGVEILEVSKGYAKAGMKVTSTHLNSVDTAQGGAIFTLADLAFAAAANSHGTVAVAINVNISFVKAAFSGDTLIAEAKENSINPKIGAYTVNVINQNKELVAIFQGMVYRKKDTLDITL